MKGDIFQWLAEPSDLEGKMPTVTDEVPNPTHIRLQVLRRSVNPAVAMIGGPQFQVTDFKVESLIRGYFQTASNMIIDKLVSASNAHRKEMYASAFKENQTQMTGNFINHFLPATVNGQFTVGGMCLLEPFAAAQEKVLVSGTIFPTQADRSTKRLRMSVETDDGIAMASFSSDHTVSTDFRMLAGDLTIGNPALLQMIAAFANVLPSIELTTDLKLPVILTSNDLDTIAGELRLAQQTLLPLWSSRVVDFVNTRIAQQREYVSSIAETEAVCTLIHNSLEQAITAEPNTDTKNRTGYKSELQAAVRGLRQDPILFIRGPKIANHYNDDRVSIAGSPFREHLLDGFDVTKLSHFGNHDDLFFTNEVQRGGTRLAFADVPLYFTTTPYEVNEYASTLNTLWNVLLNTEANMVYRLSDWEKALAPFETVQTVPVPDVEPIPTVSQSPWSSQVSAPERERQFRLSLMGSPHDTGDVAKTEIDLDSPYKPFELEMHLGNKESHMEEAMEVVAIAIRMLFTPYEMPVEKYCARDLGGGIDSIIPVFPTRMMVEGNEVRNIDVTKDADRFPAVFTSIENTKTTAALAAFLYQHAAMQASKPFGSVPPSYQEIKTLIASTNPFPLPPSLKAICKKMTESIEAKLRLKFNDCIYLSQNPSERSTVQPYAPLFVHFTQTTSHNSLNWVLGTEATPILESVILALHIVSHLARTPFLPESTADNPNPAVYAGTTMKTNPLTVDVTKPIAGCFRPQRSKETTKLFQTPEGIVDCTEYARALGLRHPHMYLRAGRGFFAGGYEPVIGTGVVGCFKASPKEFSSSDIAKKRCIGENTIFQNINRNAYTKINSENGAFQEVESTALSCYNIIARGKSDLDRSDYFTAVLPILNQGTFNEPCALPIYTLDEELVGFAYFEPLVISNQNIMWNESTLVNILCVNSQVLYPLYEWLHDTYYYFNRDVFIHGTKNTIIILKNTPVAIRTTTAPEPPLRPPSPLPFQYTSESHLIVLADIEKAIVDGAQGIHYTNTRALSKTVFAGVINTKRDAVYAYLTKLDPRYARNAPPWAYDLESGTPMATVLAYLNGAYEQSVTRATETALTSRVCVDVRGPSPDCLATLCFAGEYYYKTAAYLNAEQLLLERCLKMLRETFEFPPGSTDRCLAREFRSGRSITCVDTIVRLRPDSAAFVASLLYDFREKQSILHSTQKARNTPALIMNAVAETQKIQRLLFYS